MRPPRIFEVMATRPAMVVSPSSDTCEAASLLRRCEIIVCDKIDRVADKHGPHEYWPATPPFSRVWLEYESAFCPRDRGGTGEYGAWGYLITCGIPEDDMDCVDVNHLGINDDGILVKVRVFTADERGYCGLGSFYFGLDADGRAPQSDDLHLTAGCGILPHYDPNTCAAIVTDICYVFALMHCRNVSLVDGGYSDDSMSDKRRRDPGRGHIRYKVLKVQAGKDREYVLGRVGSGEHAHLPLHVVRGHFKTYTPDRPLFGNPANVGRYWWPAHARGERDNGVVVKDYEIVGAGSEN